MTNKGFTLAEMIVVMAITAIVGTIFVVIFSNTLRGSNKAQILAVIKQNGQAVLDSIDKTIRNSDNIICPTTTDVPSNTIVVVKNGIYTRYRIALYGDGAGTAPGDCLGTGANGCIAQDNPVKIIDVATGQLQTDTAFIYDVCLSTSLMPRDVTQPVQIVTDTNIQSGVSVSSGSFTINKSSGYKTNVTINFILATGAGVPTAISDQIDHVSFQTSIELR